MQQLPVPYGDHLPRDSDCANSFQAKFQPLPAQQRGIVPPSTRRRAAVLRRTPGGPVCSRGRQWLPTTSASAAVGAGGPTRRRARLRLAEGEGPEREARAVVGGVGLCGPRRGDRAFGGGAAGR